MHLKNLRCGHLRKRFVQSEMSGTLQVQLEERAPAVVLAEEEAADGNRRKMFIRCTGRGVRHSEVRTGDVDLTKQPGGSQAVIRTS